MDREVQIAKSKEIQVIGWIAKPQGVKFREKSTSKNKNQGIQKLQWQPFSWKEGKALPIEC